MAEYHRPQILNASLSPGLWLQILTPINFSKFRVWGLGSIAPRLLLAKSERKSIWMTKTLNSQPRPQALNLNPKALNRKPYGTLGSIVIGVSLFLGTTMYMVMYVYIICIYIYIYLHLYLSLSLSLFLSVVLCLCVSRCSLKRFFKV